MDQKFEKFGGYSPDRLASFIKTGLAVGTLALSATPVEAAAKSSHKPRRHVPITRVIKNRILHHQSVQVDPGHNFEWTTGEGKKGKATHILSLPIVAKDHGKKREFGLVQEGHTLSSLKVVEAPVHAKEEGNEYSYYNCGAEPTTKHGVIRLDDRFHKEPVTNINDTHGNEEPGHVGSIMTFAPGEPIISSGPPLPPGFCDNPQNR